MQIPVLFETRRGRCSEPDADEEPSSLVSGVIPSNSTKVGNAVEEISRSGALSNPANTSDRGEPTYDAAAKGCSKPLEMPPRHPTSAAGLSTRRHFLELTSEARHPHHLDVPSSQVNQEPTGTRS
ncbi:hypothetical protein N7468_005353 [Penicillium chermesinum]|uniref:Uncharacterized protein n=1 Tax=Penicillium chermesinum TaxID=63820 RepID=A0A9W9NZ52_9EURO|nr:uncharacterized protein N7468_005353 [Penicillium chermesinum]KAJ5232397.1 hypothetical protein N7468_005353 [Penicillium chermesinum]KAJ6172054.1 hypothetical protein N7470_001121 [Penicillium chermesinum]